MSRAFVKEADGNEPEELPELVVSPHRNLVTADGLALIDETLHRLDVELASAREAGDRATEARVQRDLRYWRQRKGSAEVVASPASAETVRFGSWVTLELDDGDSVRFRIVGEDESDPARGLLAYVSPLAEQLLGSLVGDVVPFRGGEAEIVAIE
jgi:transcription elongation GreA/GreB family factor